MSLVIAGRIVPLSRLSSVAVMHAENGTTSLKVSNVAQTITELVRHLDAERNEMLDIALVRPTLEDVFLKVTGERLAGEDNE